MSRFRWRLGGYLDKVLSVTGGGKSFTYSYHADGQLARADYGGGRSEDFLWDGLALVRRGDEQFVNEPHVGGGNPVLSSKGAVYLADLLGTTVGVRDGPRGRRRHTSAALTAFGEPLPGGAAGGTSAIPSPFFTGKPDVPGLGRVFLMRSYRPGLAKWQTADPLGYPDGWNQLAYGVNSPTMGYDVLGASWGNVDFVAYYEGKTQRIRGDCRRGNGRRNGRGRGAPQPADGDRRRGGVGRRNRPRAGGRLGIRIEAANLLVEDCDIDSDDDAICFKSDLRDFTVENVVVWNCRLSSNCNAIKFGTSWVGKGRNILVEGRCRRPSDPTPRTATGACAQGDVAKGVRLTTFFASALTAGA